jgi:hypothetical protein
MWPSLLQQNAGEIRTRTRPTTSRKLFSVSLSLSLTHTHTGTRASFILPYLPSNCHLKQIMFLYIKLRRSLSASFKLINLDWHPRPCVPLQSTSSILVYELFRFAEKQNE